MRNIIPEIILVLLAICLGIGIGNFISPKSDINIPFTKASGNRIELVSNSSSNNPSWYELKTFLLADQTEKIVYSELSFICGDYAEMLHNNAERAGIRAAVAIIGFADNSSHAINAFDTTDEGLIYIDDTGRASGEGKDCMAYVIVGKEYGLLNLSEADSPDYDFYISYMEKVEGELANYFYPTIGTVDAIIRYRSVLGHDMI